MSRVSQARAQRASLGCHSLKRQASASAGSCALAATSSMHLAPSAVEMATSTTPQHELECTRTRRRQGRRGKAGRQCERETCNMPQARRTNCQHTQTQAHTRTSSVLVVVVSCFQFSFSTQELPVRTRRLRVLVLVCVLALLLVCLWLRWCGP